VYIGGNLVTYPKKVLLVGQILNVHEDLKDMLRLNKLNRINLKRHLFNKPRYMFISHKFFCVLFFVQSLKKIWHIDIKILIFIEEQIYRNKIKGL
jgi:hypothetical protein